MIATKRSNVLAVVVGLVTIAATAEPACYRIDATAECEQVYPPGYPNDSECRWQGWARVGPSWEVYVSQKTLLLTPGSSGWTITTRNCRRVYVMMKDGQENQICYSGSYGSFRSFQTNRCVVGSGGGDT
jgi:hypothetical protein